jgi:murein tripeptide amidase MpaA
MKRGRRILFCGLLIILTLSISFVSAGWFSDFFGKITGNTIDSGKTVSVIVCGYAYRNGNITNCQTRTVNITDSQILNKISLTPDFPVDKSLICASGIIPVSSTSGTLNISFSGDCPNEDINLIIAKVSVNGKNATLTSAQGGLWSKSSVVQVSYEMTLPPEPPPSPTTGLVSYYSFNDSSHPYTDIISSINGVCTSTGASTGDCSVLVDGKSGKAASFDGNDFLTLGTNDPFGNHDKGTIAFWIKLNDNKLKSQTVFMATNLASSNNSLSIILNADWAPNGTAIKYYSTSSSWLIYTHSRKIIDWSQWTHVALVQDGIKPKLYINGILLPENVSGGAMFSGASTNKGYWFKNIIGAKTYLVGKFARKGDSGSNFFNGAIDELRIYNSNISEDEIKKLAGVVSPPISNLIIKLNSPSGLITSVPIVLNVSTNIKANCSYSIYVEIVPNSFGSMANMQTVDGLNHLKIISQLDNNKHYLILFECKSGSLTSQAKTEFDFNVNINSTITVATTKNNYYSWESVELTPPIQNTQGSLSGFVTSSSSENQKSKVSLSSTKNLETYVFNKKDNKILVSKEETSFLSRIFTKAGLKNVYSQQEGEIKLPFVINKKDIKVGKIEDFDFIKINGLDYSPSETGEPELPQKSFKIKLPEGMVVKNIGLNDGSYLEILGISKLAPKRKPIEWKEGHSMEVAELAENPKVYSYDNFFPGNVISYHEGEDSEGRYVYLKINPVQYIPSEKKVVVITNLDISIQYEKKLNEPKASSSSFFEANTAENIIIYSPGFEQSANMLKEFHNSQGTSSEIVSTDYIFQNYNESEVSPYTLCTVSGGVSSCMYDNSMDLISNGYNYSLARKIISFLRSEQTNLKYVTIIGEAKQVPPSDYISTMATPSTDFWYSSPDYDLTPNYFVGRLPAKTPEEAIHMVNKTINWENNLGDWFNNVAVAGGNAFGREVYIGEFITDGAIDMGYFDGFNISKKFESEGKFSVSEIEPILKEGNFGWFYHIGHGGGNIAQFGEYLDGEVVKKYPAKTNIPILVSIACSNGQYDLGIVGGVYGNYNESFAEATLLSNAGAVAYIGGGRTNYGGIPAYIENGSLNMTADQPYMQGMLDYVFQAYYENKTTLGEISARASEIYNEKKEIETDDIDKLTFFEFVLLGDPALKIPKKPSVEKVNTPKINPLNEKSYISLGREVIGQIPYYEGNIFLNISSDSNNIKFKKINFQLGSYSEQDLSLQNGNLVYEFSEPDSLLWIKTEEPLTKKQSWFYLSTTPPKPDVYVYFLWEDSELNRVAGKEEQILIGFGNYGEINSGEAVISLYESLSDGASYELVGSKSVGSIEVDKQEVINFSWTPKLGISRAILKTVINTTGEDKNLYNNEDETKVVIVPSSVIKNNGQTDLKGKLLLELLVDNRDLSEDSSSGGGGGGSVPANHFNQRNYGEKTLVRLNFKNSQQETNILSQDLDIASYKKGSYADIVIYENQLNLLKIQGYNLQILPVNKENLFRSSFEDVTGYHRYEDIEPELRRLEAANPSIAKVFSIGKSIEGRDIWAIKISDNVNLDEEEPAVLIDGNHHAREIMTVEVPLYFAKVLVENYTDARIKNLVDNREFWIIPTANPDGLAYVNTNDIWWRKNRRDNGDGSFGVDINRNYGYKWGYDSIGSSSNTYSDDYRGNSSFSELETQAIKTLSEQQKFVLEISYHSYGEYFLYPWSYRYKYTPENELFNQLGEELRKNRGLTDYSYGIPPVVIYPANGATFDWFFGERVTKPAAYSFAFEINNWEEGFRPDPSLISPTQNQQLEPFLYMSEYVPTLNPPAPLPPEVITSYKIIVNDSETGTLRIIKSNQELGLNSFFGKQEVSFPGKYIVHCAFLSENDNLIPGMESNYSFVRENY